MPGSTLLDVWPVPDALAVRWVGDPPQWRVSRKVSNPRWRPSSPVKERTDEITQSRCRTGSQHRGHANRKAMEESPHEHTHMQLVAERLHVDEEANHEIGQANPFEHR